MPDSHLAPTEPPPPPPFPPGAMVNLGCGNRFHEAWTNLDLNARDPRVQKANFIAGVPLAEGAAACVYHSHVLEHLTPEDGRHFLGECLRVLAPGGVLRVVVPDLEASARDYLAALDERRTLRDAASGNSGAGAAERLASKRHRWMTIELIDQMVRTRRGGEMGAMMQAARQDPELLEIVAPRTGTEGRALREPGSPGSAPRAQKLERWQRRVARFGYNGKLLAEMMYKRLGETHRWMYDELSLGDLLREIGFVDVRRMTHDRSAIPDWPRWGLDAEPGGEPYKSVSLYMEGRRPAR